MIPQSEREKFLQTLPRLASWPEREIRWLASNLQEMKLAPGDWLFAPAPESDDAFIVYDGQVRQFIADKSGEEWWFRTCTRGSALMQQRLFRGEGHSTQARAELESTVFRIQARVLNEALQRHPDLWDVLTSSTAFRLRGIPLLRSLTDNQIEILAVTTDIKEFKQGDTIASKEDEVGQLWIVDWGQVRVADWGNLGYDASGNLTVYSNGDTPGQQPSRPPAIITAGNYFCSGKLGIWRLRELVTVTGVAETDVRLLRIRQDIVDKMADRRQDIEKLLAQRPNLRGRLEEALRSQSAFADLHAEHWDDLLSIAGWEHVPADLDVALQGNEGNKVYVLVEGAARVLTRDEKGRDLPEFVLRHGVKAAPDVAVMSSGAAGVFGLESLLAADRYTSTLRSIQSTSVDDSAIDGSDWLTLHHDDILLLINRNHDRWGGTALAKTLLQAPADKEFSWLKHEETVVHLARRHVLSLLMRVGFSFLVAYAVIGLLGLIDLLLGRDFATTTYILVFLAVLAPLLTWHMVDYYNDYYAVTTRRVVRRDQVLFITESRVEATLERIQDLSTRTHLIGKLLNFGDLDITTAATGGKVRYEMIPRPEKVKAIISNLQRERLASAQAEEREHLRNQMLKKLGFRLIPSHPARALPESAQPSKNVGAIAAFMQRLFSPFTRFFRWLRGLPERIYLLLLHLLPNDAREQIVNERAEKKKEKASVDKDQVTYRKHPWFLVRAAGIPIVTLIISGIIILLPGQALRELNLPRIVEVVIILWILICLFWLWFRVENWRNDKYILSKSHIIDVTALPLGLFEERKQAEWNKVQNASFNIPNFWANLLDFGTVFVETASTLGNFDFINIPHPAAVQQEIFLRMEAARQAAETEARRRQQSVQLEALELYNQYKANRASPADET